MTQNEYLYDLLVNLSKKFDDNFMFLEIGVASGTSSLWALKAIKDTKSKRWLMTVDPYGDKPYKAGGDTFAKMDYNDDNYREAQKKLKDYVQEFGLNHCHWKITSLDFINIFPQVSFWSDGEVKPRQFAFVFLDGDHNWNPVKQEFDWFYERIPSGGVIAIDDYNLLDGEQSVREVLKGYQDKGEWFFNTVDEHYRCYFTKK